MHKVSFCLVTDFFPERFPQEKSLLMNQSLGYFFQMLSYFCLRVCIDDVDMDSRAREILRSAHS